MFGIPLYPKIKLSENVVCSKQSFCSSAVRSKKSLGNNATCADPNDASIFAKIVNKRVDVNDAEISTTPNCVICDTDNPRETKKRSQNSNNEVSIFPACTSHCSPTHTPITASVRERNAIATLHPCDGVEFVDEDGVFFVDNVINKSVNDISSIHKFFRRHNRIPQLIPKRILTKPHRFGNRIF